MGRASRFGRPLSAHCEKCFIRDGCHRCARSRRVRHPTEHSEQRVQCVHRRRSAQPGCKLRVRPSSEQTRLCCTELCNRRERCTCCDCRTRSCDHAALRSALIPAWAPASACRPAQDAGFRVRRLVPGVLIQASFEESVAAHCGVRQSLAERADSAPDGSPSV